MYNNKVLISTESLDPNLEIRKLSPRNVKELVKILEYAESWKSLMAIIPKQLEYKNYNCDVKRDNLPKYHSEHFRLIENASEKYKKTCTEILFDEWGTSGKVRPTLGHLLHLLVKANLFRAADYIAVQLLKQLPPKRPSEGPAALVPTDLKDIIIAKKDPKEEQIEQILDQINYPSSAIENIISNRNSTTQEVKQVPQVVPKIVVIESPDVEIEERPFFEQPQDGEVSDMMKFSSNGNESVRLSENQPQISKLMGGSDSENIPNISALNGSSESVTTSSELESSDNCIPALSALNIESEQHVENEVPAFSQILSDNAPHLSALMKTSSSQNESQSNNPALSALMPSLDYNFSENNNLPNVSILNNPSILIESHSSTKSSSSNPVSNSDSLPNFGALLPKLQPSSGMYSQKSTSKNSRICVSPLPNLSLNTQLPHYSYCELEKATNNFDASPYSTQANTGRFLGSGAFGSVFLALGLLDHPVAVKKLMLEDVDIVNVDDTVTKQFKNEVEVLSKYRHENLLSLLGYSCDGSTYCLLYEFIPGGALKDRLQASEEKLIWTERLYIALGTARAVSYLHTGFSTPLIHRDIKTANILLDATNKPKLCDFGLIKLSPSQNTNTGTTVFGTSAYMAPEAFRGDISIKLDTFSFGVVLLELLTSLPPYDENREGCDLITHIDETCDDDISMLLDTTAGAWTANDVDFGQEIYKLARKCLEEKRKRPTMLEVTRELDELIKKSI